MSLSAAELAEMRTDIETLMPDTCVLQTKSAIADGMGGETVTWTASGTVSCRVDRVSADERTAGGALRPYQQWMLSVPYGTSITAAMRVVHGGVTYNVESVNSDKSWPDSVRATLEIVT